MFTLLLLMWCIRGGLSSTTTHHWEAEYLTYVLISSVAAKAKHWLVCFQIQCSDSVSVSVSYRPEPQAHATEVFSLSWRECLTSTFSHLSASLLTCCRTFSRTAVPERLWCHIGQHRYGGGATLANTDVVVVPHWPTPMWWWCHTGQHRCGGGATLANTDVVVVPHWPTPMWW